MARNRFKAKGRRESGPFIAIPRSILDSPEYASLSPRAVKLLLDVYALFRGANNGDLSAAFRLMHPRGWSSKDQLEKARRELIEKGWLGISRRPKAKREPELYYLTFLAVDACKNKLDISETTKPTNEWRQIKTLPRDTGQTENKSLTRHTGKLDPRHGANPCDERSKRPKKGPLCPAVRVNKSKSLPRPAGPFLDSPCSDAKDEQIQRPNEGQSNLTEGLRLEECEQPNTIWAKAVEVIGRVPSLNPAKAKSFLQNLVAERGRQSVLDRLNTAPAEPIACLEHLRARP